MEDGMECVAIVAPNCVLVLLLPGVKTIIAEGDGANRESFSQLVQRASDWLANGLPEGATLANLKCQYVPLPCAKSEHLTS